VTWRRHALEGVQQQKIASAPMQALKRWTIVPNTITITAYSPLGGLEHRKATAVQTLDEFSIIYD
jgi:hypothetical protein